jgi:hypothetical protein
MTIDKRECPVCYETDKTFDGKCNSDDRDKCMHYVCMECCQKMYNELRKAFIKGNRDVEACCPLCREKWTMWLLTHYEDEVDYAFEDLETDDEE